MPKKRILFVCLGNIIRSPLAENMFRHLAQQAGVGHHYEVDSAGIGAWHVGEPPDPRMVRVAAKHGLHYGGRARQFTLRDFDNFDLIIAMDLDNRAALMNKARCAEHEKKIHLLREFDSVGEADVSVPDPYYGGQDGFEEVYTIVERACRGLLEALEQEPVDEHLLS